MTSTVRLMDCGGEDGLLACKVGVGIPMQAQVCDLGRAGWQPLPGWETRPMGQGQPFPSSIQDHLWVFIREPDKGADVSYMY